LRGSFDQGDRNSVIRLPEQMNRRHRPAESRANDGDIDWILVKRRIHWYAPWAQYKS
jgi:hypothetical protein